MKNLDTEFLRQLKTADKTKQVKKRIEEEYYVNPEIAREMISSATTVAECNAILREHFSGTGLYSSTIV